MCGVWTAHFMFEERIFMLSTRARSGPAQMGFVAAFGFGESSELLTDLCRDADCLLQLILKDFSQ